jgi:hypothetical protein
LFETSAGPARQGRFIAAYVLLVMIVAFELFVLWCVLHPNVPEDYRAYFIDHTTTCLNQPVSGTYRLGEVISFLPDGADAAKPVRVCGWEGPVGNGTHAVGERSRLRFTFKERAANLVLTLEMIAVESETQPSQQVNVVVNGTTVQQLQVGSDKPQTFRVPLPPKLVDAADGRLDVILDFPTALRMAPTDGNTRKRSIKLLSASVYDPAAS